MKTIKLEMSGEWKLVFILLFIATILIGIVVGTEISKRPVIVIDTSHSKTIDWFVRYHGQIEDGCHYNYQGGITFERDGETISLFTNDARSAYAKAIAEGK